MASLLLAAYPLPRPAWVSEDQLTIRASPATSATALGVLPAQQKLIVVEFSTDRQWSRITAPANGWVHNRYIQFLSEGTPAVRTVLGVEHAQVIAETLNVRSGPGTEFSIVQSLGSGQKVIIVAAVTERSWQQIIMPVKGWGEHGIRAGE